MDWSPGETPKNIQLYASLKPGSDKKLVAGEPVQLELSVENKGTEPFKRLRAWTESDNGFLDRREYVFGTVKPGEKKTATVTVKTPKDLLSRRDGVTVRFQDDKGTWPDTLVSELNFGELARPSFAFNYSVLDDCAACNGDGVIQRGEDVTLLLDVTNTGTGKALDTFASIKNASDQNVFIEKGRFKLGEINPGETQTARFRLQVKKGYKGDSFGMRAYVIDEPLEEFTADKLMIPVAAEGAPVAAFDTRKGTVKLGEKTELFASAEGGARVLAKLPKGAVLNELGRNAQFVRVELAPERFAFVRAADAKDGRGQKAQAPAFAWQYFREPPAIALSVDTAQGGLVAEGERYTLSGVVTDPSLIDMYVLVNDQKVFFKGAAPADEGKLKFTTEFALKEGNNLITVVARESADFAGRKTIVVRRRPAAVAAKLPAEAPTQAKP
jgi:carboxyl-terminal processing protease